jgi:serine/threonine protein kinase
MSIKDGKASVPIKGVRREIEYAASVQHDNVVKLIDFVADEQQIVIVWELIQGIDLLDLLNEKGGRLEEVQAAHYFSQLLRGVDFIHNHGLCHRDLKPENCMVERGTDKVKIIDFGLSKHQQSAVTLGVGTPDYMAPELLGSATGGFSALQERKVGQYDAKACDIWAMGVLLYLLVTGQYPFEDPKQPQNVVATLQNISQGKIRPLPRRISTECADLIAAMLTKNPAERITLQNIALHPWMKKASGISVGKSEGNGGDNKQTSPAALTPPAAATATKQQQQQQQRQPMDVDKPRVESFSFPAPAATLASKATPITPKVINLNANTSAAATTSSPTVSAPHAMNTPTRDRVVPVVVPATIQEEDSVSPDRRRLVPAFCRMWFSS